MSLKDLLKGIAELNTDPAITRKFLQFSSVVEAERWSRSRENNTLYWQHSDLVRSVCAVLVAIKVECGPSELYRLCKPDHDRSMFVKVVLPTNTHWGIALVSAPLPCRIRGFENILSRKSTRTGQSKQDYELRKLAKEYNSDKANRESVAYRGMPIRISELSRRTSKNM